MLFKRQSPQEKLAGFEWVANLADVGRLFLRGRSGFGRRRGSVRAGRCVGGGLRRITAIDYGWLSSGPIRIATLRRRCDGRLLIGRVATATTCVVDGCATTSMSTNPAAARFSRRRHCQQASQCNRSDRHQNSVSSCHRFSPFQLYKVDGTEMAATLATINSHSSKTRGNRTKSSRSHLRQCPTCFAFCVPDHCEMRPHPQVFKHQGVSRVSARNPKW